MLLQKNVSLKTLNTFGVDANAAYFSNVDNVPMLHSLLQSNKLPIFILGGGSNVLFTKDVAGLVLKNNLLGKNIVFEDENVVHLAVASGENWHELVLWSLEQNYGGLENLSLIFGTVGAAPIQNIGAYGVELKEVFVSLQAIHLKTGQLQTFSAEDCQFGYRDSFFKRQGKNQYFITQIVLQLTKRNHIIQTHYGDIRNTLQQWNIAAPTIQDVSRAVTYIRQNKLPNPYELGNAGSFFKNPSISQPHFLTLMREFPTMPNFPQSDGSVKIPAAWLIEQCSWKGKRVGDAGVHQQQALVLVNHGMATGEDIISLAKDIQSSVLERFGISIEMEVNVL